MNLFHRSIRFIVIVLFFTDVYAFDCPSETLTIAQLAQIVAAARTEWGNIPAPFPQYTTDVLRLRCLYLYYEIKQPDSDNQILMFTIDPYGSLMDYEGP